MKLLKYNTYMSLIENSVGTKMFQNLLVLNDLNKVEDVMKGGTLSCAYYVSNVLLMAGLIKGGHATVDSTKKDMLDFGWIKINELRKGAVVIWETKTTEDGAHHHIGFYLNENEAVSNSAENKIIAKNHPTYNGDRKIEEIYWHPEFDV